MASKTIDTHHNREQELLKAYQVITIIVFLFLVCLLGFILIAGFRSRDRVNPAYAYARQTQTALEANPTPTPFQPETVGFVPEIPPQEEADPETGVPAQPEATPVPTLKPLQKPEGQVNILLLGSDRREDDYGFRTDSITWLSLNPEGGFVSAVSFPRDLFVEIPGYGENRINTAFGRGGFELLADTMEINFGVHPDYYVLIEMAAFKSVINNLGGIYVQAETNLTDYCEFSNPDRGVCSLGPGQVYMDADDALWYARSRVTTNDIDRARRTQEVIKAIFNRLMSLDAILKAPDLYKAYTTYVETDIDLGTVVSMLPLAKTIYENSDVRNYVIGFDYAYSWITTSGASVLVPDKTAIQELMIEALEWK